MRASVVRIDGIEPLAARPYQARMRYPRRDPLVRNLGTAPSALSL
jgi:hypothetical protein